MSPDDIFAAQFWPWPDPAIKRDNQGRVLFINAAFLQLYGGTVQDWTGNVVGGWPAPQGPGQPYRFETRIPMTHELSEQVYDWMEMTLADGHAFALARNVTSLIQPPEPPPAATMPEQHHNNDMSMTNQSAAGVNTAPPQMAEAYAAAPQDMAGQANSGQANLGQENLGQSPIDPVIQGQAQPAAAIAPPVSEPVYESGTDAVMPAQNISESQHFDTPAPMETVAQASLPPVQVEASDIPNDMDGPQERAFERRALPIEDDSAVLGNNWRDAVIAKAVGADAAPAKAEPDTQPVPEPSNASTMSDTGDEQKRILLAEDNAINALLTRTLLEAEGHIVETVQDGQLAVEAMKTSQYDLIFMDMRMPNMDGLEATRKIRTLPNVRKDLPIIALTANAFDDDRNACFDSGMNDFMTKPVSAEELSEMVGQWTKPREDRMAS